MMRVRPETRRWAESINPFFIALPAYFACMALPLAGLRTFADYFTSSYIVLVHRFQIAGVVVFSFAAAISLVIRGRRQLVVNGAMLLAWSVLIGWYGLSVFWSVNPVMTAVYVVVTTVVIAGCTIFWSQSNEAIEASASVAVIAIGLGMVYLASSLKLGERSFGGVTPNEIGHFGFAAIVLAYLSRKPAYILGALAAGVALIAFSQARTALLALLLFLAMRHLVTPFITNRSRLVGACLLGGAGACVFVLVAPALIDLASSFATRTLGVTDIARSSGSGFSGRERSWEIGRALLSGHTLLGYGYRTRGSLDFGIGGIETNVHSGLLNAALDTGVLGCLGFIAVMMTATWSLLRSWAEARSEPDRLAGCFLVAMWPVLVVEGNYMNFAAPSSFLMTLFLAGALTMRRTERVSAYTASEESGDGGESRRSPRTA